MQDARNSRSQPTVRQDMNRMLGQCGVTPVGRTVADGFGAEIVRQVARADDFDAVGEYHHTDRSAGEIVAVDQRIDQQFFDSLLWHLQATQGVEATPRLKVAQVAFDEGKAALVLLRQGAANVLAVQIMGVVQCGAGKGHRLDLESRAVALWVLAEQ